MRNLCIYIYIYIYIYERDNLRLLLFHSKISHVANNFVYNKKQKLYQYTVGQFCTIDPVYFVLVAISVIP